jgi:hypothetical protein
MFKILEITKILLLWTISTILPQERSASNKVPFQ